MLCRNKPLTVEDLNTMAPLQPWGKQHGWTIATKSGWYLKNDDWTLPEFKTKFEALCFLAALKEKFNG